MSVNDLSRRNFLKGAALGAAALSIPSLAACSSGSGSSSSSSASSSYTYADTIAWDAEYDVVVLGIGFAGLASAMSAADEGATVLIAEKLADGAAGGNSRVCGQMFLYGNGDVEATKSYISALADTRTVPDDMLQVYAEGYANIAENISKTYGMEKGDFIDVATIPVLAPMSPEYPEFSGSDKAHLWATHAGVSDSYLYQSIRSCLVSNYSDKVDVWFESPATELIQDPASKAIIGVTVSRGGKTKNVRANNGVVLACGGFENDRDMVQQYMNFVKYACIGSLGNTGDGIKMAQNVGAKMWHMTSFAGGFGLAGLTYVMDETENAIGISTLSQTTMNTGACILVGANGMRWCNESETPRHGKISNKNGQWLNPEFPKGIYVIYDQTQMDAITAAKELDSHYTDSVVTCASIAEAAKTIGCSETTLTTTIADFNSFAAGGKDYQFGRDAKYMRAFEGNTYYVMPLEAELLNTQGGPQRNASCQVIGLDEQPIPHLFEAGEIGGIVSFMYAGGMNVGECFISGQIAGLNAAAAKDPLPAYAAAAAVTSNPSKLGAETDLTK